jgi:hypothetical protein
MRRFAALLVGLTLVLAGCGRTMVAEPGDENDADAASAERMIGVYSAVIRRLITVDHTFGSGPSPFDRVFIVDGVAADAGGPAAVPAGSVKPFSPEVKAGIIRELADLPPVEFVANPDSVVVGEKRCAHVKWEGVLITLGPISGGKDSVTVPNGLFFACLGGQWLTYELEHADGDWQVTGTKGPIAIS